MKGRFSISMIGSKITRSLVAMFWGWLTCNLSILIWVSLTKGRFVPEVLVTFSVPTAIVILVAWLLAFLPADLLVPETSVLREPLVAGVCGALSAFLPILLFMLITSLALSRPFDPGQLFADMFGREMGHYVIGATVTGSTAALTLVLRHPRKIPVTPFNHEQSHHLL